MAAQAVTGRLNGISPAGVVTLKATSHNQQHGDYIMRDVKKNNETELRDDDRLISAFDKDGFSKFVIDIEFVETIAVVLLTAALTVLVCIGMSS